MSEIEEIRERWFPLGFVGDSQDQRDVKTLLSSLESKDKEIERLKEENKKLRDALNPKCGFSTII